MRYANCPGRGSALTAALGVGLRGGNLSRRRVSRRADSGFRRVHLVKPDARCWECCDVTQTHASRRPYALERWVHLELGSRPPDA